MTQAPIPTLPASGGRDTLLVGQAGGPTPVINSSLVGIIRAARATGLDDVLPRSEFTRLLTDLLLPA